tara:strand:- start:45 stop:464 length:420 start_codon:yes stop_codon:yes gene_type:complete
MIKKYKAMVLSCIDPRFQSKVFNYLKRRKLVGKYSSFTIAGAAVGITNKNFKKWQKTFIENLSTSIQLHKINRLIVINHKDCGAAKLVNGKNQFDEFNENKIHEESFKKLKKILNKKFPKLYYEFYLMNLKSSLKRFNV